MSIRNSVHVLRSFYRTERCQKLVLFLRKTFWTLTSGTLSTPASATSSARPSIRWRFRQHFTSSFYASQISKVQKDTDDLTVFLCYWDLCTYKLHVNMFVKLTPVVNFTNIYKQHFHTKVFYRAFFSTYSLAL
jgi:hypothetical protein